MAQRRSTFTGRTALGWTLLTLFRGMEEFLPPALLRGFIWPTATLAAFAENMRARNAPQGSGNLPHIGFHAARALAFIPDRLASPRWRQRFQLAGPFIDSGGIENKSSPIILATLHFGPLYLMRYALRARGLPVTTLIENSASRSPMQLHKDRMSNAVFGMTEAPHVISRQELFKLRRNLSPGNVLMASVDHTSGRHIEITHEGTAFRMATGAMRLAAAARARLVPCLMAETGPWKFTTHFGQPVPPEYLGEHPDYAAAGRHLLREFLPLLKKYPEQFGQELADCFQPASCAAPVLTPEVCLK